MDKKLLTGVIIAVVAVGGIVGVVLVSKKDTTKTADTSQMDMSKGTSTTPSTTPESQPEQSNATDQVKIEDFSFGPSSITVKKGTTVTWTNKDSIAHTVTADSGQTGPDSELLDQGKTYSFTFDTAGTFTYHCKPHPNMTGTVIVTE